MQAIEPLAEPESPADDLARECLYRFLSAVAAGPYHPGWAHALDPDNQRLAVEAADLLRDEADTPPDGLGPGESPPEALELSGLVAALGRPPDELRAEHDRVFGLLTPKECPPYETEYYPSRETFARSQQLADIAGFYRAFGIEPSGSVPERPDHLALELEFLAFLLLRRRQALADAADDPEAAERAEVCERARSDFVRDHLAWWVPAFAAGLRRRAGGGYQHALAVALAALVPIERARSGVPGPHVPARADLIEQPDEQSGCAACPLHT